MLTFFGGGGFEVDSNFPLLLIVGWWHCDNLQLLNCVALLTRMNLVLTGQDTFERQLFNECVVQAAWLLAADCWPRQISFCHIWQICCSFGSNFRSKHDPPHASGCGLVFLPSLQRAPLIGYQAAKYSHSRWNKSSRRKCYTQSWFPPATNCSPYM